jgi:gamma-glutamylcysteine synthetase
MSFTREQPELERPIERMDQLLDLFRRDEGERGIGALFDTLVRDHGFQPLMEGELILSLARDATAITLEPGGAFELAGAPLRTLHETCREFRDHIALMKYVSSELGIIWLRDHARVHVDAR